MSKHLVLAAVLALSTISGARADRPDDANKCTRAIDAFETGNLAEVRSVHAIIKTAAYEMDQKHARAGEPAPMAQLTDGQINEFVTVAVWYCQQNPDATISNSALWAYNKFRDMVIATGD